MADYERLVKELNTKLSEKDECVEELKAQINGLNQKEEALKQEIGMITGSRLHSLNDTQNNTIQISLMLRYRKIFSKTPQFYWYILHY